MDMVSHCVIEHPDHKGSKIFGLTLSITWSFYSSVLSARRSPWDLAPGQ
jgi:hypothetical protein